MYIDKNYTKPLIIKPLLILDLDETLIHASETLLDFEADFRLPPYYYVYQRPYLSDFLNFCNKHFELAIWSSASEDYVNAIVQKILPPNIFLQFVWSRKRCTPKFLLYRDSLGRYNLDYPSSYQYLKQLKKVRRLGYDLKKVLIVDDTPTKVMNYYGNAIYIKEFRGEQDDLELLKLSHYLLKLRDVENVRSIEKRGWSENIILDGLGLNY